MQEKFIPPSEKAPVDETAVIANLHSNHDGVLNGHLPLSEKLLTEIRDDLSRLECYPMYKEYAAGSVPTLAILSESVSRTTKAIEALLQQDRAEGKTDADLAEELKIKKLLEGRITSIRRNIAAYIQSVIHFHRLKQNYRDNPEDFEKADKNRQRVHENLLQSLKVMTQNTKQAHEEGLLATQHLVEWMPGMNAQALLASPGNIVVFSDKTLTDRDYIKDWAIAADFDTQLQEMLAAKHSPHAAE